jgi:hypothetical protein
MPAVADGNTVTEATIRVLFTTAAFSTKIPPVIDAPPVKGVVGEIVTFAPERKLVPRIEIRIPDAPLGNVPGATLSSVGATPPPPPIVSEAGLERLMKQLSDTQVRFRTWTMCAPDVTNSLAPRLKVSCVAETRAVGRASTLSNKTVEVVLNPVPVTVKVADVSPAGTEAGLSDVTVCPGAR